MSDTATRNLTDKATYERLEKDVTAVKNDIAALTDQITDALNSFAGTATKQARRGYKQARANAESAVDDLSERGSAMMDAAQDAASSIEETLEDVITQRPLATVGLALGLGFLIGVTWRRYGRRDSTVDGSHQKSRSRGPTSRGPKSAGSVAALACRGFFR